MNSPLLLIKSLFFLLIIISPSSFATNITEKLIVSLIDKNLPATLFEQKETKWQMGLYDLTVKKIGNTRLKTSESTLIFALPIKVIMDAQVIKTILGSTIKMSCKSDISTDAFINVIPGQIKEHINANVIIDIPLPESYLNCEGVNLPITPMLSQLIKEEKNTWEEKIEKNINLKLKELGL